MQRRLVRLFFLNIIAVYVATAQTPVGTVEYLPPADPGYYLYFHDDGGSLEKPERWGYHDGWLKGRLDRSEGHQLDPKLDASYIKGQLHGSSGSLLEVQYLRTYRSAYLRGYEHGYRI